jgi:hypothetical protein
MYQISNRQYDEVVEFLSAFVAMERGGENLRIQNRYRRARLLIKQLRKRNPVNNSINIQNK